MSNFLTDLPKPFFVLAPMDDVTDTVFRQLIADAASPDVFFTEFVNVDALQSEGRKASVKRLLTTPKEQPLVVQIWGKTPENYFKTAQQITDGTFVKELGLPKGTKFAGVDINMGCPDKAITKNGCCSALIQNRDLALKIIDATKKGLNEALPLSVKTRLGYNHVDLTWHELLLKQDLAMLTIHGRTKKEMSKVPSNWDKIAEIRQLRDKIAPNTLIVGNGDVDTHAQGQQLAKKHKLDGIMIGRGVFKDPFVFAKNSPWQNMSKNDRLDLYAKHVSLFAKTWQNTERRVHVLNKFCKIYVNGFDGAKDMRDKLMHAKSTDELLNFIESTKS